MLLLRSGRVQERCDPPHTGHRFDEQILTLTIQQGRKNTNPCRVPARSRQRNYQAIGNHIFAHAEDGYDLSRLLQCAGVPIRATNYRIGCSFYDRSYHGVDPISLDLEAARNNIEIVAFDETVKAKFIEECNVGRTLPIRRKQTSEAIHSPRLLRPRRERPRGRAAERSNEFAPFKLTKLHSLPQARVTKHNRIGEGQSGACCSAGY
jgi:hypothetical protein